VVVEKNNFPIHIIGLICFIVGLICFVVGGFFLEVSEGNPEGYEEFFWGIGLQLSGCCLFLIGTIILIVGFERWKRMQ
tara:strand:+ start:654 stop:887 length:234 start_codon:yes stop_codon:yes gene_type:complete